MVSSFVGAGCLYFFFAVSQLRPEMPAAGSGFWMSSGPGVGPGGKKNRHVGGSPVRQAREREERREGKGREKKRERDA